jgi:hypothetical protein
MALSGSVIAGQADGHAEVVVKDELGQIVAKVPNGEILTVLQNGPGIAKVRWNNVEGWAKATNLKALPPVLPATAPTAAYSRVCENGHTMRELANFCHHCGRPPRLALPQILTEPMPARVSVGEADAAMPDENIGELLPPGLHVGEIPEEVDPSIEQMQAHEATISLFKPKQAARGAAVAAGPACVMCRRTTQGGFKHCCRTCESTQGVSHGPKCEAAHAAANHNTKVQETDPKLLADLNGMSLRGVKRRAFEMGVGQDTLDDADGNDDPKQAVIQLILSKKGLPPTPAPLADGVAVAAGPACVMCRRPTQGGFKHCCRTCESTQGQSHGHKCEAAHAAANHTPKAALPDPLPQRQQWEQ